MKRLVRKIARSIKKIHELKTPPLLVVLRLLVVLVIAFSCISYSYLASQEMRTNIKIHAIKREINSLQSTKYALQLKEQELAASTRIRNIVEAKGMKHTMDSEVAAVMGDEEE